MKIPNISCNIHISSSINPSEDPEKVKKAILNIFPNLLVETEQFSAYSKSNELRSLEKIYEAIRLRHSQKIYLRTLEKNLKNDTTWFYLNKQAAFVEKIAICEESDESPLGPIKIILTSSNIDGIIDWMVSRNSDFS